MRFELGRGAAQRDVFVAEDRGGLDLALHVRRDQVNELRMIDLEGELGRLFAAVEDGGLNRADPADGDAVCR